MKTFLLFLLAALTGCVLPISASTIIPAPRQKEPVLLAHGTVYTVSGAVLENTDVLFVDGRVTQIGPALTPPPNAVVINVTNRRVYPGLVAANTQLGLAEIGAIRATVDTTETGTTNPDARAQVALMPTVSCCP